MDISMDTSISTATLLISMVVGLGRTLFGGSLGGLLARLLARKSGTGLVHSLKYMSLGWNGLVGGLYWWKACDLGPLDPSINSALSKRASLFVGRLRVATRRRSQSDRYVVHTVTETSDMMHLNSCQL